MPTTRNRARLIAALAGVAALNLSACGESSAPGAVDPRPVVHFDGPEYSSVKDLGAAADIVVVGKVTGLAARVLESELQGAPEPESLPIALYEMKVDRVLKGGPAAESILVTRIDTTKVATDDQTPFEIGQEALLFLRASDRKRGGLVVHSVVGMDQGRLEVVGGRLRASRSAEAAPDHRPVGDGQTVEEIAAQLR